MLNAISFSVLTTDEYVQVRGLTVDGGGNIYLCGTFDGSMDISRTGRCSRYCSDGLRRLYREADAYFGSISGIAAWVMAEHGAAGRLGRHPGSGGGRER
ncbi:MAG: hypothetical protein IPL81_16640 [Flavobacteriales bacterium]|nr:hypothetical protein [Flavobacteriales bacterium]